MTVLLQSLIRKFACLKKGGVYIDIVHSCKRTSCIQIIYNCISILEIGSLRSVDVTLFEEMVHCCKII